MNTYRLDNNTIDSIELKCLVVSRGLRVSKDVYKQFSGDYRLSISPLTCNCFFLSDGTVVQLTDMGFHLKYLGGMLSWSNLKLLKYASELGTPFTLELVDGKAALMYSSGFVDFVSFPPKTDFYQRKTFARNQIYWKCGHSGDRLGSVSMSVALRVCGGRKALPILLFRRGLSIQGEQKQGAAVRA